MNRRLPRFVLLVVLLALVIGTLGSGGNVHPGTALAQSDPCGPGAQPTMADPGETPTPPPQANTMAVTDVAGLSSGEQIEISSELGGIIYLETGEIELTVCDSGQAAIQESGSAQVEVLDADTHTIGAGSTVFLASGTTVYLKGVESDSIIVFTVYVMTLQAVCGSGGC